MQGKYGNTILDDFTLSRQELLKVAADLSLKDKVYTKKIDDSLMNLSDERRQIESAYLAARQRKYKGLELPPLSEWFYDNRFLLMEQIKQIETQKRVFRLPHLKSGRFAHLPRSLALAMLLLGHSALNISVAGIQEFLEVYQKESELNSGELWAFTDMLKVTLLRAVAVLAADSVRTLAMWNRSEKFCESIEKDTLAEPVSLNAYKSVLFNQDFLEHTMVMLRDSPHASSVVKQINFKLKLKGFKAEQLIKKAHTAQANNILYISGAIASLRLLAKVNFEPVFESVSAVHKYLSEDPDYPNMDFHSREYYRSSVTAIADALKTPEPAVARAAAELAGESGAHVGEFIVGTRKRELYARFGRLPFKMRLFDFFKRHMLLFYAGGAAVSTLISAALLTLPLFFKFPPIYGIVGIIISLIPIYTVAITISNRLFTLINKPMLIPKMSFKDGIPDDCATMVVVPALVTSEEEGRELLSKMEVYWAANQQKNIYFTLLSDFKEDKNEIAAQDEKTIESMESMVGRLNSQYGRALFFYAQRKRTLIKENGRFGGYERKRGALLDFCALLSGDTSAFAHVTKGIPADIKYIISLDADTELSRDAAVKMVGAMEHPLNRPVIDKQTGIVKSGFGVMQPRIGIDVVSAAKTRFSLVFSGKGGLDTYASAASDVYQDGFGTGIFTGKGIFNRHVYAAVLKDRFPDNSILSHDLLEGSHIRCALLSDVVLMDGCPARYTAWASRQHRWVRGDWQLLPWLKRMVPTKTGKTANPLSGLAKYQIFDNMRRSLSVPLSFVVILLSQTAFYNNAFFWFVSGILPLFIDSIIDFISRMVMLIKNARHGSTFKDVWYETKTMFEQALYKFAFLPYETYLMLDAVTRSLVRLVTRRKLLEWVTAAEGDKKAKMGVAYYWRSMAAAPLLAAALFALSILVTHRFSLIAFLIFSVWFFAPSIAQVISRPRTTKIYALDVKQKAYLEDLALKTWRFFERFSEETEYYWPPDNYQQSPFKGIAKRTSPTNIAYGMGAAICAYYLGFNTLTETVKRLDRIVAGLEKAEKWQGHLYNWYDIVALEPLEPRYVSSVDSGNLICYLIVTDEALKDMLLAPFAATVRQGLDAVSRESGREQPQSIGGDIFTALSGLAMVSENDDTLSVMKQQLQDMFARYASWAQVLEGFPAQQVHEYIEYTRAMRDRLRHVSVSGFSEAFHAVLEPLSAILQRAKLYEHQTVLEWVTRMEAALGESYVACRRLTRRIDRLRRRIAAFIDATDFSHLYDEEKGLFSIGYDCRGGTLSDSYYDLLASEARQTSFIAIANGDVPEKHWFRLSRPLTIAGESRVLLSWSGTMFEYLMPLIIMKNYDNTLLGETYKSVVDMQHDYGEQRHSPWGVSESGYYAFDINMNYQYKAFGIPGLGLKSGLVRELVVTPYATALALNVNPRIAIANMMRLQKIGAYGRFGFYEAIDYTTSRLRRGKKYAVIKSYMAHHQGMILSSVVNCLQDMRMQTLFHSATNVKATEMLLKEKVPPRSVTLSLGEKPDETLSFADEIHAVRVYKTLTQYPEAHFLSNGSYTVMLTQYGTGYSMGRGRMVARWESDVLRRAPGIHIYIKNTETGAVWSAAFLPTCLQADAEQVQFEPHKASFYRKVGDIETTLDICVSPECDMEVRNLDIRNNGTKAINLMVLCVYSPALSPEKDFEAHPAFAELFIETVADQENRTLYAERRGRPICSAMKACFAGDITFMTDRTCVFGRRNVFGVPTSLSGCACEHDITRAVGISTVRNVPAGESASLGFAVTMGESRHAAAECLKSLANEEDLKRVFHLAWTHAQVEMRYLKLKSMQVNLFQQIASRTVISMPSVCATDEKAGGLSSLWKYGISGDLPIICLFVTSLDFVDTVKTMGKAMEYMSLKQIPAELVILYSHAGAYIDPLRDTIKEIEQTSTGWPMVRVYALNTQEMDTADAAAVATAACLVLYDNAPLMQQLKVPVMTRPYRVFEQQPYERIASRPVRLLKAFDNGSGGYIRGGSEYCIEVQGAQPLPWSNLLAGHTLGSLISAGGGGYTWAGNARMLRLTPFRNDALTDVPGEGVLVRSDRTGHAFSVAPDMYAEGRYRVIHGFGYTVFERYGGIETRITYFVDEDLPVKAGLLSLTNTTKHDETLSVYAYAEPVLAATECGGIRARYKQSRLEASSPLASADKAMFLAMPGQEVKFTASAQEFFGVPGHNVRPEALKVNALSDSEGCSASVLALQTQITLKPGENRTISVLMGWGGEADIARVLDAYGTAQKTQHCLDATKRHWNALVNAIKVKTSSKSLDTLVNGWLLYQTYTARLWGRTGYYQSGGAFGFRDQLQDVLSILYTDPSAARAHILKCAQRQFIEGDVLHWWHEPSSGVRTYISDDKLFLPYTACEYERITGDMGVFDEMLPYLISKPIPEGRHDLYESFEAGETSESLFSHCVRAIDSALRFGEHGLPLMGAGDWNDGMDKVGIGGKGESVWLGFFLVYVLRQFSELCRLRGETDLAERFERTRQALVNSIEQHAWDGEWYMRAFFDDGTPLGSSASPECRIDIISQAWAVLTGAVHARHAFAAAREQLVLREEGIIRLLTPAFDKWEKDPGYIKQYLPGVRENGGQYTHAAVWFVIAAAKLRQKEEALSLFQMLNPINHTRTPAAVAKYKGEPYVMAADVYDTDGYRGRAGWTWYTGSAGWMYQAAIVHLLGLCIERGTLSVSPCVPDDFGSYSIEYKKGNAQYIITVAISPGYQGSAWLRMNGGAAVKSLPLDAKEGIHRIDACWHT